MEELVKDRIKCPIFLETDMVIKNVISKFQKANSKEKQYYAEDILIEIDSLLSCDKFNGNNPQCINCHSVSHNYLQEYESIFPYAWYNS